MVAVTPPSHPLAGKTDIPLRDLVAYPFIDFDIGWGTRPLVDRAFGQAGLQRKTDFDVTDLETVIDLVGEGLGIALLPETIAALRAPTIATCRLQEPEVCWELLVAYLRGENDAPLNGAAQAFLDLLTFW
jgi:DNA-binding transcriptional LysR family regulator